MLRIPFDVQERFGARGRLAVRGTINGHPFRSSIFPTGDGTHHMMINKSMQQGAGAGPGDTVTVAIEPDAEPRQVEVPDDLRKALARSKVLREAFDALSPSRRKLMIDSITGAKRPETRGSRVKRAIQSLTAREVG